MHFQSVGQGPIVSIPLCCYDNQIASFLFRTDITVRNCHTVLFFIPMNSWLAFFFQEAFSDLSQGGCYRLYSQPGQVRVSSAHLGWRIIACQLETFADLL